MEKIDNKKIGAYGEKLAQEFLIKNGYEILECNKKFSRFCEVDIIAKDKQTLVFIEVKTRSSDFCGNGFEAITPKKYENIKTGLFLYLKEQSEKYKNYRIDCISIILKPKLEIKHLKNI